MRGKKSIPCETESHQPNGVPIANKLGTLRSYLLLVRNWILEQDQAGEALATTPTPAEPSTRWAIAPLLLVATIVDLVSSAASFRLPLKLVCPVIYWSLFCLAFVFLLRGVLKPVPRRLLLASLLLGVLTFVALRQNWPNCAFSDSVVPSNDAWSYTAFSKYLWENSRGVDSGLPILDEYGSHLSNTRFATAGMLGFLSSFSRPGDPASAMMLFIMICHLGVFWSLYYLCRALGLSQLCCLAAGFFGCFNGWVSDAMLVGNLDNLLFLPLFTSFVGALIGSAKSTGGIRGYSLTLILCGSASFYCYPEGLIVGCFVASPIVVWALRTIGLKEQTYRALLVCVVAVIVVSPYIGIVFGFLPNQFAFSQASVRPGEGYFSGLLHASSFLPAVFALGEELPNKDVSYWNWLLPIVLSFLLFRGVRQLKEKNGSFVWCLLPFGILVVWQIWSRYDYGLFKVLLDAAFLWIPMIACGISVPGFPFRWRSGILLIIGAIGVLLFSFLEREEDHPNSFWQGQGCVTELRHLSSLRFLAPDKAVVVNISNAFLQSWAIYYMRDVNTILAAPVGSLAMPHIQPYLARARPANTLPIAGRLEAEVGVDHNALWSDGSFSLLAPVADKPLTKFVQEITSDTRLLTISAGKEFVMRVTVKNIGLETWPAGGGYPVDLGYVWYQNEKPLSFDTPRVFLQGNLLPGASQEVDITVKAPTTAGRYTLKFTMLQERVAWFFGAGAKTLDIPVTVK
jgi:hypothetical protein